MTDMTGISGTSVQNSIVECIDISNRSETSSFQSPVPHHRFARKAFFSQWIPEANPRHPRANPFTAKLSRRDIILWTCTGVSFLVFLINLISTIFLAVKYPHVNGIGTITRGTKAQVFHLNSKLHFGLNALSTLLLGASNMCMQLCVSPTRKELDSAHDRNEWLDIGVPSVRNIRWISRRRQLLFFVLALSSLPLHFLWNSAILPSLVVNTYVWGLVHPDFVSNNAKWKVLDNIKVKNVYFNPPGALKNTRLEPHIAKLQEWAVDDSSKLERLDHVECLRRYTNPFGARADLLLVTVDQSAEHNNTLYAVGSDSGLDFENIGNWMCRWGFGASESLPIQRERSCGKLGLEFFPGSDQKQRAISRQKALTGWLIKDRRVDYCLSSNADNQDLYTVLCIFFTGSRFEKVEEESLSILGDAVASFLKRPDLSTQSLGFCSKEDILQRVKSRKNRLKRRGPSAKEFTSIWHSEEPKKWTRDRFRWWSGASRSRWIVTIGLCILTIIAALVLLILAMVGFSKWVSVSAGFAVDYGTPSPHSIVDFLKVEPGMTALFKHVLFANLWQFAISFLYVLINALISSLLVGSEWAHLAKQRKPLRVSSPQGLQRSSFFISMPYKYGIPLMGIVTTLHWTASQAVFLVKIAAYYYNGDPDYGSSVSAVGFSMSALAVSILLGAIMVIGVVLLGFFRKYDPGMPMASTCSAAISAACHPPEDDFDARYFPVMWGIVDEDENGYKYCSFTTANDCRPLDAAVGWREKGSDESYDESQERKKSREEVLGKLVAATRALKESLWRPVARALQADHRGRGVRSESTNSASDVTNLMSSIADGERGVEHADEAEKLDEPGIFVAPWPETLASRQYEEERIARLALESLKDPGWMALYKDRIFSIAPLAWF